MTLQLPGRRLTQLGLAASLALGPTFYVDPAGNDNNDGRTQATPWATIAKVNAQTWLVPNTKVLFKGGATFTGALVPNNGLSALTPLVIGSYGTGKATLTASSGYVCHVHNIGGIRIENLIVNGTSTAQEGVFLQNDQAGNTKMNGVAVVNCDFTGTFSDCAVYMEGSTGSSGFSNVLFSGITASVSVGAGIGVWGAAGAGLANHSGVTVHNCVTTNCGKSGINLGNCTNSMIQLCKASGCGGASTAGPVGIWFYDSSNCIIQFCESYNNNSANAADGGGFDLDGGSSNCIVQYCFSHGNKGAGFLIYGFTGGTTNTNSTVRYCISVNDGTNSATYGGILIGTEGPAVTGVSIYGNTIYQNQATRFCIGMEVAGITGRVANNIFMSANGAKLIKSTVNTSGLLFTGNNYWNTGAFSILWNNVTYSTFASWQTAFSTQEKISAVDVHRAVDPLFVNAGGLTAADYKLQSGSPMIGTGLDLSQFSISVGVRDYFGNTIPQNSNYDIGAHEYAA